VRDRHANAEVPLRPYAALQAPRAADGGLFRKGLLGRSCRNYRACAEALPAAFGLSGSTVSRRFIRAPAQQLARLRARRLEGSDIVALILDGKTFADDSLLIALGITGTGEKGRDDVDQARRAAPARPENGDELSRLDVQVDPIQRDDLLPVP
jgi:hypothetical protein